MKKYNVIDNYMPADYHDLLLENFLGENFPWYACHEMVRSSESSNVPYFAHVVYRDHKPNSDYFDLIVPVIEKLNINSLIRVKVNNYPKHDSIIKHGFHKDYNNEDIKTCIYYINTNNGGTIIKGEKMIESVQNRALILNTNLLHTSTSHTDTNYRVNLVINYM